MSPERNKLSSDAKVLQTAISPPALNTSVYLIVVYLCRRQPDLTAASRISDGGTAEFLRGL